MNRCIVSIFLFPLLLVLLLVPLQAEDTKYTCPMHPHYISDTPGSCPICGMDLVPIQAGSNNKTPGNDETVLQLSSRLVQTTGFRTEPAEMASFGRLIRSFGEVVANKRLQTEISLRTAGWVEELIVDAPGDKVRAGDILFRLYSPDLVSAQQDYISALQRNNQERIDITRSRLASLGVHDSAIKAVAEKRKPLRAVPYYAPRGGRVESLTIRKGSYLRPGDMAMLIQDYDTVWVNVSLAEQDISFVTTNSKVNVTLPSLGLHIDAVPIDYISPTVDPKTRTAELRLLVENSNGSIRPGAYADVEISTDIRPRLSIPYESVLQNKEGNYVIVELIKGEFQARSVVLGMKNKGRIEVQTGLKEGETIVTSGQFLIDSESSLRESFHKMQKMAASLSEIKLSNEQMVLMNHIVEAGLYIHEKLAAKELPSPETLSAGAHAATKLLPEVEGTRLAYIVKDTEKLLSNLEEKITLSHWRALLAQLNDALLPWITQAKPEYYRELGLALYKNDSGEYWLQFAGDGHNPYSDGTFTEVVLGNPQPAGEVQDGQ
ncbi:efflux RND transporter periplasmic adaptor subunit [Desulforhopalus sp. IMCC35007]|uniref:efflux RND transporter periplasmic adaptor subunit n=1 Tax=Desulforhopalus sp. IMCC35007 TaxID=2569543 RepID=UPI0010ADD4EF|nr:efflux RND transporter periplasmic adaptor subunit [Desulforhopalus sp. IMCC35007]TKB10795.1 efflux RND transporter periplasmic adaptor subunit [Desulforhopalus sp. IMCC35007]